MLIACVSPAAIHADESLNTLRYAERTRSITNAAKQNTLDKCAMLTPAQVAALIAETKILKARIANLTRRKQAANDFDDNRGMEFSGLEAKLRRAKVEAKAARDSCNAVASTADRLRERFMTFAGQKGVRGNIQNIFAALSVSGAIVANDVVLLHTHCCSILDKNRRGKESEALALRKTLCTAFTASFKRKSNCAMTLSSCLGRSSPNAWNLISKRPTSTCIHQS